MGELKSHHLDDFFLGGGGGDTPPKPVLLDLLLISITWSMKTFAWKLVMKLNMKSLQKVFHAQE